MVAFSAELKFEIRSPPFGFHSISDMGISVVMLRLGSLGGVL
jgi:hypothetical protein